MDTTRSLPTRMTRQRRLVYEILQSSAEHLDAESVFELAKRRDAKISLATVYRSLAWLKEARLIQEHRLGENHAHFETTAATPHYHFSCLRCGRVVEFEAAEVREIARQLCAREDLEVTDIHLHLSGLCSECREDQEPCN
jgi:Fur family transcriptional regulator, ferric uptake regulator